VYDPECRIGDCDRAEPILSRDDTSEPPGALIDHSGEAQKAV
jgi:hypothetical protein